MRAFLPIEEKQASLNVRPTLRTNRPAAAYARRSDQKARDEAKDKSQSREMQTEDMIDWGKLQGWNGQLLFPYFADLGLSGALRPDQRPDMLRMFDDIDAGKFDHGAVICWQENRLFRDETQIYYNQFIQKCLEHDILVVVVSPYLMIYDFRDEFMTEMFRWKCKESADFIKRHVKGWMLPARYRAAWVDGEWAGLGDPPTGFIVDFDEDSPTYKKFIPYWPHAEKKRELRELFIELGCNTSLLYRQEDNRYVQHRVVLAAIACDELDTIIVNRLMEHVHTISEHRGEIEKYEQKARAIREKRQSKIKQIDASVKAIDKDQAGLTRSLGSVEAEIEEAEKAEDYEKKELKERLKQLIVDQINTLEHERRNLIQTKTTLEEEAASELGSLDKELENLETSWPKKTFEKRRSLINFLVREVVIDTMSTHWLRVQVLWLHEEWGREEMYYCRNTGRKKEWAQKEKEILRAHYATMPKPALMQLLPDRGWEAIRSYAFMKGLTRTLRGRPVGETIGGDDHMSYTDIQFMKEQGLDKTAKCTNWVRLSFRRGLAYGQFA